MGLMLCVDRKIPENIGAMKEGKWQKGKFTASVGMKGKSLGLLGLGNIGKEVATRALAFGMKVYAWDKFVPEWVS
jgi:D-3-phosphoglycerate dehydrogenase / 2-oxoglutarate reductase